MKRFSILCCLVLLLNVLCPVGHVHAEGITTPSDLCDHQYGNWAEGDDCVFGCLKCKMVEQRYSHTLETYFDDDGHWNMCLYCEHKTDTVEHTFELQSNEVSHRWQCTGCEYFKDDDVHVAFCDNPGVCAECGYKDENLTGNHTGYGYWADGNDCVYGCLGCKMEVRRVSHLTFNENGHGIDCSRCGTKTEFEAHDYVLTSDEDCHWYGCTVCGHYKDNCAYPHEASCTNPGVCKTCGYEDESINSYHEYGSWADGDECVSGCLLCGMEDYRSEHEGSCKDPTHCKYCGAEGDWYADHNWDYYSGSVNDGAEGHHYICQDCGASSEAEKHYAYCDDPTHCIECGYEGTIVRVYHYTGDEVLFDEYKHWDVCTKCGKETHHSSHYNDCTDPNHCMYCDYEGTIDGEDLLHGDCVYVCEGDTGHRYECTECGYVEFTSAHVADCTNPNYCISCGYEGPCTKFYHHYTCASNGADGHTLTCVNCGTTKTEAHYTYCDDPNHCLNCDYEGEIADVGHYWAGNEGFDADNHWYICPDCGITITEPHYNGECGVESPCGGCYTLYVQEHKWGDPVTANGVRTYTCTLCGATKTENLHTHKWGEPVTVEPTCTTEGTATYTCTCGQTKVETIEALGHTYGACVPTGSGSHTQTCTVCGNTIASSCTMVDTTIGNLDASACIYCGYITWKLDDAANGKQESKAVENAAFQMVDENGAAVDTSTLTLVVYESAPDATIQLDTGASLAIKKALTVTVLEGGAPAKLANTVKLSIPMADDLTGLKLLVVDENGELVEIAYEVIDGVMTFETDILGIFMLVQEI